MNPTHYGLAEVIFSTPLGDEGIPTDPAAYLESIPVHVEVTLEIEGRAALGMLPVAEYHTIRGIVCWFLECQFGPSSIELALTTRKLPYLFRRNEDAEDCIPHRARITIDKRAVDQFVEQRMQHLLAAIAARAEFLKG